MLKASSASAKRIQRLKRKRGPCGCVGDDPRGAGGVFVPPGRSSGAPVTAAGSRSSRTTKTSAAHFAGRGISPVAGAFIQLCVQVRGRRHLPPLQMTAPGRSRLTKETELDRSPNPCDCHRALHVVRRGLYDPLDAKRDHGRRVLEVPPGVYRARAHDPGRQQDRPIRAPARPRTADESVDPIGGRI
jgi:hypothetical protein